jgi:predicted nucleic-acid-binding protein
MTAVDTNVVVRLLTHDDRRQAALALSIFETEEIWVAKTVLLETSWVLQSIYNFGGDTVWNALTMLLGLPNVQVEDEVAVAEALSLFGKGVEFADALHLKSKPHGAKFMSFDGAFVRRARRAGITEVQSPAVPVRRN